MPRYIDADALIFEERPLKDYKILGMNGTMVFGRTDSKTLQMFASAFKQMIDKTPTADVVPRSEVGLLQETCDLFSETIKEMDKEIERLKVSDASKEECTIRQHCEIKELKAELNKAKQEVAKEIIAEFKSLVMNYVQDRDLLLVAFKNAVAYAEAELKKKYIGG